MGAANERNALITVTPDGVVQEISKNGSQGPLEFPAALGFVGDTAYIANFDTPRRDNLDANRKTAFDGTSSSIAQITPEESPWRYCRSKTYARNISRAGKKLSLSSPSTSRSRRESCDHRRSIGLRQVDPVEFDRRDLTIKRRAHCFSWRGDRRHLHGVRLRHPKDNLFPWRTLVENVEIGLEIRGIDKNARRQQAEELIERVGLRGFEEHYPHELSGGMRQRTNIIRDLDL